MKTRLFQSWEMDLEILSEFRALSPQSVEELEHESVAKVLLSLGYEEAKWVGMDLGLRSSTRVSGMTPLLLSSHGRFIGNPRGCHMQIMFHTLVMMIK